MHRLSISIILHLRGVEFDSICVFENSFYSLSCKDGSVLLGNCFLKVVLMFGARFFPIIISGFLLTSCSGTDWLENLEAQTGGLVESASSWLENLEAQTGGLVERSSSQVGDLTANEDEVYSLQLEVQDVDIPYGDKLSFSMVSLPSWLSLSRDGLLKGTPKNADVGMHEITVRVTDRAGKSDDANFVIDVLNTNDSPKFVTNNLPRAVQDNAYEVQLEVADDDLPHGDVMRFNTINAPIWLSVSDEGLIQGTPKNADVGEHVIVVEVFDKAGVAIQKELKITAENINDAPILLINNRK